MNELATPRVKRGGSSSFIAVSVALWALVLLLTLGFFVHSAVETIEDESNRASAEVLAEISARLATNEAILAGFSHLADEVGAIEQGRERLTRVAEEMIGRFPHIYALEIVSPVAREDLADFIARQRASWNPNFQARRFDYASPHGDWAPLEDKPVYHLLTFIAPETPEVKPIYGLDVAGDPTFAEAIEAAVREPGTPASLAFRLAENGEQALTLLLGARTADSQDSRWRAISEMIVRLSDLMPASLNPRLHYELRPLMPGTRGTEPLRISRSAPASRFMPIYLYQTRNTLGRGSQRFELVVTRPIHVEEMVGFFWAPTLLIGGSSLALLLRHQRRRRNNERALEEEIIELESIALYDPLTGLPNRRLLGDRIEQAIARAQRLKTGFAIAFVDLDGFKSVNDHHGHATGDELLRQVAERLRLSLRASDTVARFGGDEFVVLMPDIVDRSEALDLAAALRSWLSGTYQVRNAEFSLGASVGVALYPADGSDTEGLLKQADQAMYRDKRAGRTGERVSAS